LAAACRSIIGLDEYSVEPVDSTPTNNDPDASDPQSGPDSGNGNGTGNADGSVTPNDDGGSLPNGGSSGAGGNGGAPAVGGGGAGGAGGAGGMPNAGAGGSNDCSEPVTPSGCISGPGGCDGMCQGDSCVHVCSSPDCGGSFEMSTIVACGPPSIQFPCIVDCKGGGLCPSAIEVSCPDVAPCMIQCIEPGSCNGARIVCRGGGCQVNCGALGCDETTQVDCGTGPCIVVCEPGADVDQTPGLSCDAQAFGCGQ
jgi:hypothetical protein